MKVNIQDMRTTNCAATDKGHTDKGPGLKAISQRWTSESRVTDAR